MDAMVGSVSATDDTGEPVTYAIAAGNDDERFAIGEDTGEITVAGELSGRCGDDGNADSGGPGTRPAGEATVTVTVRVTATCDSGTAAPNPAANPGLVSDCEDAAGPEGGPGGDGDAGLERRHGHERLAGHLPERPAPALRLRNSGLQGVIPTALGDLTGLQDLLLSGNRLTGEIPPELGNLTSLYSLNLDQNRLTGEIPAELGNMSVLEDLFLFNNQLYRERPAGGRGAWRSSGSCGSPTTSSRGCSPVSWPIWRSCFTLRLYGNSFEGCVAGGFAGTWQLTTSLAWGLRTARPVRCQSPRGSARPFPREPSPSCGTL